MSLVADAEQTRWQLATAVENIKSGAVQLYRMDERKPLTGDIGKLQKYLRYYSAPRLSQTESFTRCLRCLLRPAKARA